MSYTNNVKVCECSEPVWWSRQYGLLCGWPGPCARCGGWQGTDGRVAVREEQIKSLAETVLSVATIMEHDVESALAYQQRPKGGQSTGPPSTPFCNTPPSGLSAIRKYARWLRTAAESAQQDPEA